MHQKIAAILFVVALFGTAFSVPNLPEASPESRLLVINGKCWPCLFGWCRIIPLCALLEQNANSSSNGGTNTGGGEAETPSGTGDAAEKEDGGDEEKDKTDPEETDKEGEEKTGDDGR